MIRKSAKVIFLLVVAIAAISWLMLMYWVSWRMVTVGYVE